jgi:hypothetical protein
LVRGKSVKGLIYRFCLAIWVRLLKFCFGSIQFIF